MGDEELAQLKKLYDELWRDARTMIKDLNRSVTSIFLFGVVMLAMAVIEFGTAVNMYSKIAAGSTLVLNYFYFACSSFGVVVSLAAGVMMLRYYFQLKNRYAKVIELEKVLGD
jgi:hypothetical protein